MNVPGESTLRREFLRLQQENKSNSEALKQQQQLQQQQQRDPEAHIKHLLHQRQRRIEEQKEERRRVEEVGARPGLARPPPPRRVPASAPRLAAPSAWGCRRPAERVVPTPFLRGAPPVRPARDLRCQGGGAPHTLQRPGRLPQTAVWSDLELPSKGPPFIFGWLGLDLLESTVLSLGVIGGGWEKYLLVVLFLNRGGFFKITDLKREHLYPYVLRCPYFAGRTWRGRRRYKYGLQHWDFC